MGRTHLAIGNGRYACGVGRRWSSQTITSTRRSADVTCRACHRTHAYRDANG